ncbi:Fe2+-dependent dioxygenase [Roseiterribacter gracilis]|uniref:PKHD-type hydroxylase n=1 Tax=Roseiterribacter gracilis TaxID=2812848 RepID=A0A8S8XCT5_9PROT|nr:PKHD-type hydroxylase [Rhodospirillales bacterium TMPK1]
MIICIGEVLAADALREITGLLDQAGFVEGRSTAGWAAREVKHNLQLSTKAPQHARATAIARGAIDNNATFKSASLPRALTPLLFSRSETGMGYGAHVDNAMMGDPPVRTDLAFTLFLSAPEQYEGGALVIDDAGGEQEFKLPAGAMVLYPATTLHRVEEVTRGRRDVAVGWVQSLVRDPRGREMLFDLDRTRRALFERDGKSAEFDTLQKTYSNLLRMLAET